MEQVKFTYQQIALMADKVLEKLCISHGLNPELIKELEANVQSVAGNHKARRNTPFQRKLLSDKTFKVLRNFSHARGIPVHKYYTVKTRSKGDGGILVDIIPTDKCPVVLHELFIRAQNARNKKRFSKEN